ncbi:MAG: hypothetical protein KJ858_05435, partial [Nanoarchaeota archaeon]|nr:hypothetical protein [Nanoarchaeota archaeon]
NNEYFENKPPALGGLLSIIGGNFTKFSHIVKAILGVGLNFTKNEDANAEVVSSVADPSTLTALTNPLVNISGLFFSLTLISFILEAEVNFPIFFPTEIIIRPKRVNSSARDSVVSTLITIFPFTIYINYITKKHQLKLNQKSVTPQTSDTNRRQWLIS